MNASATTYDLISGLIAEDMNDDRRAEAFGELVRRPITPDALEDGRKALQERMVRIALSDDAIDTCGTGGSGKKTINTSTLTALIVAAAGGKVAKHGNRSASGNCGCFDLLEHLGVKIDLTSDEEKKIFEKLGIVFLFARTHHPAMRFVGALRKAYGKKTIFNYLGPLCNPAGVTRQLIGTGDAADAALMGAALRHSRIVRGFVVSGDDGLDEVTVTGPTDIFSLRDGKMTEERFAPMDVGLPDFPADAIEGGDPKRNAAIFLALAKVGGSQAMRALVLVNATFALLLTGIVTTIPEAYALAEATLKSGKVLTLFEQYRTVSNTAKL